MDDPVTPQDPQDVAEALDADKVGTTDDPDIEPAYPPDRPLGVEEYGTTAAEEQIPEPLEERVQRERSDLSPADAAQLGRLVQPDDEDVSWTDDEATAVAREAAQADLSAEEAALRPDEPTC